MFDRITQYYANLGVTLPQEEIDILSNLFVYRRYSKKELLFKEGDIDLFICYILKGTVRVFIKDKDKKEYNRFFAFDDWWIGEYHQIISNLPCKTSAQALANTEVLMIDKQAINILFSSCPVCAKATLDFYLKGYAKLLEKEEVKKTMTIEELYIDLVKNKPEIISKIPLYHIASYLGVKPESLSRVKKKFKNQE